MPLLLLQPVRGVLLPTLRLERLGLLQHLLFQALGVLLHLDREPGNGRAEYADGQQGCVGRVVDARRGDWDAALRVSSRELSYYRGAHRHLDD